MFMYQGSPYMHNNPYQQRTMYLQYSSQPAKSYLPSGVSSYSSGNKVETGIQYRSQPVKSDQSSGVSSYASGNKVETGMYIKGKISQIEVI